MANQLTPSDPNIKNAVKDFKDDIMKDATSILSDRMPQKILYFNKIVSDKKHPWMKFQPHDIYFPQDVSSETWSATEIPKADSLPSPAPPKRLRTTPNEGVHHTQETPSHSYVQLQFPPHPQIGIMVDEIKSEIAELVEMAGSVKLFIQLNVPRIEGGNNFGVQIQEEAINELLRVEDSAFSVCNSIVDYFNTRAKFATKIQKYPNIRDYREALKELDEKNWLLLKTTRIDMRNNYAMLYDLLSKNWERVVKPRQSDTNMIY